MNLIYNLIFLFFKKYFYNILFQLYIISKSFSQNLSSKPKFTLTTDF